MNDLNFIYGTIDLIKKVLKIPYNESSDFTDKYYRILENVTDKQLNFLRALCHKKDIGKLNQVLKEFEVYAK